MGMTSWVVRVSIVVIFLKCLKQEVVDCGIVDATI